MRRGGRSGVGPTPYVFLSAIFERQPLLLFTRLETRIKESVFVASLLVFEKKPKGGMKVKALSLGGKARP